jgi:hypothetical protein
MNKKTRALAFTLAIAAGLFSGAANADFSGPYDVSKWNGGAPYSEGVDTHGAPSFIVLFDHAVPMGESGSSFFTINAVAESNITFDWETDVDAGAGGLGFAFFLDGVYTDLATGYEGDRSGSFSQHVEAGDEFGFSVCCSEHFPVGFSATISNFNVTAVPEPDTYALMLAGLGLLGFMVGQKKQLVGFRPRKVKMIE